MNDKQSFLLGPHTQGNRTLILKGGILRLTKEEIKKKENTIKKNLINIKTTI